MIESFGLWKKRKIIIVYFKNNKDFLELPSVAVCHGSTNTQN
jgi:hypothetical protein